MTDRGRISEPQAADAVPPIEEAYRRIAKLHYALATADGFSETLHQRAIDDLMDVLEILDRSLPPRPAPQAGTTPTV
jgi:hypothetical protein